MKLAFFSVLMFLKETLGERVFHAPLQQRSAVKQSPLLVGIALLALAGLFSCSGGNSSEGTFSQAPLASTCNPPNASGSPPIPNLNSTRVWHTATLLLSGTVLVAGGGTSFSNSSELYDPGANSWTAIASPMTSVRSRHTATLLLPNGTVLVAGGFGTAGVLASAELYDPVSGQWTATAGSLLEARAAHTATLLLNGTVLVAGGSGTAGALASVELYDPVSGQWTATARSLLEARAAHTATLLPNGTVLVAGGFGTAGVLASAELYDPATGQWTATGSLSAARTGHTATLLLDGTVLVAGGFGTAGELASAELYDPATGQWTATGSLSAVRTGHTATLLPKTLLLPNVTVLVAGGSGTAGALASAETVIPSNRIQATLIWNPVSDPSVQGYKVYYGTAPRTYQQVIDIGLSTTYAFANLQSGTTYYFSVTAYNLAVESCASNEASKTIP